jgi:hypothetical protein
MNSNRLLSSFGQTTTAQVLRALRNFLGQRSAVPMPFQEEGRLERRRALRQSINPTAVLVQELVGDHPKNFEGWVLNCSVDGLAVLLDVPLDEEQLVSIRSVANVAAVVPAEARVRYSNRVEGGWQAGVEFIRTPLPEILKSLGF